MGKILNNLRPQLTTLRPTLKAPPKMADKFYTSPMWRKFIADIKRERGRYCQVCGSTNRVIGDHIHELKDGGAPYDPSNIELLCIKCHNKKTAQQRQRRKREQRKGGGSEV